MRIPSTEQDDKLLAADKVELRRLTVELYAETRKLIDRMVRTRGGAMMEDERRVQAALAALEKFINEHGEPSEPGQSAG